MVPVKIECECGQNYAFDVEPVNGRMPTSVSCPDCGADGTAAANDFISQSGSATGHVAPAPATVATGQVATTPPTPAPAPPPGQLRLGIARAQPAPSSAAAHLAPDNIGRSKLEREARTKMMGGDSTEQVAAFLTVKGFDPAEAMEMARGFYQERASIVRTNGVKKTIVGLVLTAVPFVLYFVYKSLGRHYSIRGLFWAYGLAILGGYMFISGLIMIVAPKSEKGTVVKE